LSAIAGLSADVLLLALWGKIFRLYRVALFVEQAETAVNPNIALHFR
jgi:hypothetical protein